MQGIKWTAGEKKMNDNVVGSSALCEREELVGRGQMVALTVGINITQMDTYALCKASSSTSASNAQAALMISDWSTFP